MYTRVSQKSSRHNACARNDRRMSTKKRKRSRRAAAAKGRGDIPALAWQNVPAVSSLSTLETRQAVEAWVGHRLAPHSPPSVQRAISTFSGWIDECPPPLGMTAAEGLALLRRYARLVHNAHSAKQSRVRSKQRIAELEALAQEQRSASPAPPQDTSNAERMMCDLAARGDATLQQLADLELRLGQAIQRQERMQDRIDQLERAAAAVSAIDDRFELVGPPSSPTTLVCPVQAEVFREFTEASSTTTTTTTTARDDDDAKDPFSPAREKVAAGTAPGAPSWDGLLDDLA